MPQPSGMIPPSRTTPAEPSSAAQILRFLRRQTAWAVAIGLGSWAFVFLGSRGLIRNNSFEPIFDGALLGAIVVVVGALLSPWWAFDTDLPDSGFPRRRLGLAVLLAGLPWAAVLTTAMLAWPHLLRGGEHPWHVDSSLLLPLPLPPHAAGLVVVALVLWAAANLGWAAMLPVFAQVDPLWLRLVFVGVMLVAVFAVTWWGSSVVDGRISVADGLVAIVVLMISMVLSQAVVLLVQRLRTA
ncbi:hypothetical protein [Kocuria palustris]|uniref:hypothetical protein n=1 Tax=Kocuria palustris TaxID=71999 RepID=UPI0011AA6B55|nr:hypothetical protein [Kocuria palustris]